MAIAAVFVMTLGAIAPPVGHATTDAVETDPAVHAAEPDAEAASPVSSASAEGRPACTSVPDCLEQMTLDEKIGQMTQANHRALASDSDIADYALGSLLAGGGGSPATGNSPQDWADMVDRYQAVAASTRLGIPIIFGIDAVHGHNNVSGATIFPHNIGLGATRNPELVRRIGEITAREVYATGIPWSFSPCLCVARDERWGRTYESFGEDPGIASMMTTYIDGLQGTDLGAPNTILATAKHWVGDGGTTGGIDQGDTQVDEEELRSIHVAPYIDAIERDVGAVMPSFSSWNGEKLHGHEYLLTDVLRTELGFDGFVISDWAGIDQLPGDYASDVRTAINAGIDMVMVPDDYRRFIDTLRAEVEAGNIPMERIDEAVSRILEAKFALGLFERPFADRTHIDDVGSSAHRDVARQAVRESLVLLKNDGVLPLPREDVEILVAGGHADNIGNQSGGWTIGWQGMSGDITPGTTILEAIEATVGAGATVTYDRRADGEISGDLGVVVVGELPYAEGQGDSWDLALSASDVGVIERVCDAMPCVVVLVSGRPMIITDLLPTTDAFVAAWLPGTEGQGVADVLFGDSDFSGTLPMTWPRDLDQVPINVGDADYDPLFPFGFGLRYEP
ncbi:MAG: glycoside hydrolase family 3 protein [Chloroflexota bacterium]|jgi:beta-glucosidase